MLFATDPSTGGPGQVSVSLLLSHRLSITRSNLAVLESMFGAPAPGPGPSSFKRVTKVQAADASPSLVEVLEQLDIAAGRVSGAVCDACSAPRPADAKLKMCSRCHLAACVVAPLYTAAIAHVRQPTGTAASRVSRSTGLNTQACAALRALSCRVTL